MINVTQPSLPDLNEFINSLEDIWERKWLTNNGKYHELFEQAICDYLGVKHCSLLSNGTMALIVGLQALRITGEVITTPYSFVATTHALHWNGIKPVFCDIDEETLNIDPNKIEAQITPQTTAIMPVHVYGNPCDIDKIEKIASDYGLKIIYDAAHAFGVKKNNIPIVNYGDMSILSFHATKVFNTIEGGAIITSDEKLKKRIDLLKNFGFADETTVVAPGINAKMNEIQSAYGLILLKNINKAIEKRNRIALLYRKKLININGIKCLYDYENVKHNYSYFPIFINQGLYGHSRDFLYDELKKMGVNTRKYFYPLISQFPTYRGLTSSRSSNLPIAEKVTNQVLCLPIYENLPLDDMNRIIDYIVKLKQ